MTVYENTLTLSIFMLGVLTIVLSVVVAFKFNRYKQHLGGGAHRLSSAISWQLLGEATLGMGTMIFSAAAYLEVLGSWSIELQSMLRFVMFFATSVTTWHLLRTLQKLDEN